MSELLPERETGSKYVLKKSGTADFFVSGRWKIRVFISAGSEPGSHARMDMGT